MSTRIPSSLVWLIKKRARLDGKIQRATRIIEQKRELESARIRWQADLAAIDRALGMHEVLVDVENIAAISPKNQGKFLPHGDLTRFLLKSLRESDGQPLSTDTLTLMTMDQCVLSDAERENPAIHRELRLSVRYRLKNLASQRVIARLSCPLGSRTAFWTLLIAHLDK